MQDVLGEIALPAGTLLFAKGDAGACAYLIKSGSIEIFLDRNDGELLIARRGPGEIVGEMAVIDARCRSASARVTADCELVVITSEQIAHRMSGTDPILRMCLGVVIARYREMVLAVELGANRTVASIDRNLEKQDFQAALGALSLESELRRALQNEEFELFYQPIVHMDSRRLAGFEALIRWRHPDRGLVSPGEFIPLAEASGVIVEITDWCLRKVGVTFPSIMVAALQNVASVDPLFMSINISALDLARPSFVDSVAAMLRASGIAASSIKLEVTESVLMKDPRRAVEALNACRQLGLTVAIDDFGTGYSSLSYLSSLPITTIKIDRTFVHSMTDQPTSRKIVHMILRLAEEMELPVVAEGVEDEHEASLLTSLGCAFAQGYLYGKPAPLIETLKLVNRWCSAEASAAKIPKRA